MTDENMPVKYVKINGKGPTYALHGTSSIDAFERLQKELSAAYDSIRKANAQTEHFEREWYLRGDGIERLRDSYLKLQSDIAELIPPKDGDRANDPIIKRVERLVAENASLKRWREVVIEELFCCGIYTRAHEADPKKAICDAINWNVDVALDPKVSAEMRKAMDAVRAEERNRLANALEKLAKDFRDNNPADPM